MNCPECESEIIIKEGEMRGMGFHAKVWYAACLGEIGDDPNWGGGYDCEFFIVRESEKILLDELQRLTKSKCATDTCPYCLGSGKGKMSGIEVRCLFCAGTGKIK